MSAQGIATCLLLPPILLVLACIGTAALAALGRKRAGWLATSWFMLREWAGILVYRLRDGPVP